VAEPERLILSLARDIDNAMSGLHRLDDTAHRICERIRQTLDCHFVALQLIDPAEQIIQTVRTVYASGTSADWYKIARHSLQGNPKFLDIQAHVALADPPVIEIIEGWDRRFDEFIYRKFGHEHFVRAFVPLIVRRDAQNGGAGQIDPQEFRWEPQGSAIRLRWKAPRGVLRGYEIIGTVEAGFDNSGIEEKNARHRISHADARMLFAHACEHAFVLYQATLPHVLEVITRSALNVAHADCAALRFPFDPEQHEYKPPVWAGRPVALYPRSRRGGLADQAINKARYIIATGEELARLNPEAYAADVRTLAAYPLIIKEESAAAAFARGDTREEKNGVLYVGFDQPHEFTQEETDGLQLFANLAKNAIRQALQSVDTLHSARQLANLHDISGSLAHEADSEYLLASIAGHSLNVLAADVVIIYEYDPAQQRLRPEPATAGQRERLAGPGVDDSYLPPLRLMGKEIKYAQTKDELIELYVAPGSREMCRRFVETEGLVAGAAVPLWSAEDAAGLMFVNYRRPHRSSDYEKGIISTLASTVAIAIQQRRLLRAREEGVRATIHQLHGSLGAILDKLRLLRHPCSAKELREVADRLETVHEWIKGLHVALGAGGLPDDPAPIDLDQEIRAAWDLVKLRRGSGRLKLTTMNRDETAREIVISRIVIRNVLYCLLDNAVKYGETGSQLIVEWGGSPTVMKVRSVGAPIYPDEKEAIFQKFRQGRGRAAGAGGIGLGLWVTRQLLESAGGEIGVEIEEANSRKKTFTLRLPA
jgi:GAF domain-containing protein